MSIQFKHVVSTVERDGGVYLQIHRDFSSRLDLCSEVLLPERQEGDEDWDGFERTVSWLGHFICMDSPGVRKSLGIDISAENNPR